MQILQEQKSAVSRSIRLFFNSLLDLIKSAIPASGIFDLNDMRLTPRLNENIRINRQEADRNSPLFLDPADDTPMLVVVGAKETRIPLPASPACAHD